MRRCCSLTLEAGLRLPQEEEGGASKERKEIDTKAPSIRNDLACIMTQTDCASNSKIQCGQRRADRGSRGMKATAVAAAKVAAVKASATARLLLLLLKMEKECAGPWRPSAVVMRPAASWERCCLLLLLRRSASLAWSSMHDALGSESPMMTTTERERRSLLARLRRTSAHRAGVARRSQAQPGAAVEGMIHEDEWSLGRSCPGVARTGCPS
jgi:hypothetical protein